LHLPLGMVHDLATVLKGQRPKNTWKLSIKSSHVVGYIFLKQSQFY